MKQRNLTYREKYRPDDWVYVVMIAILAVIRFVPISLGSTELDDAVNDLAVGGCASALVAWLIDAANCSKKNKELRQKERMVFAEYCSAINDLIYFVVGRCQNFICDGDEFEVMEWLEKLSDKNNYPEKTSPATTVSRAYYHIGTYTRNVKSALVLLRQQYCMLVESDIVDTDDLYQHISLQMRICDDICDALELNSKDYGNAAVAVNESVVRLHNNASVFFPESIPQKYDNKING